MIRVEVILEDAIEIWNVPSVPGLSWMDNNSRALQIVFADLKRRAVDEGLFLGDVQMHARNPEFSGPRNE